MPPPGSTVLKRLSHPTGQISPGTFIVRSTLPNNQYPAPNTQNPNTQYPIPQNILTSQDIGPLSGWWHHDKCQPPGLATCMHLWHRARIAYGCSGPNLKSPGLDLCALQKPQCWTPNQSTTAMLATNTAPKSLLPFVKRLHPPGSSLFTKTCFMKFGHTIVEMLKMRQ